MRSFCIYQREATPGSRNDSYCNVFYFMPEKDSVLHWFTHGHHLSNAFMHPSFSLPYSILPFPLNQVNHQKQYLGNGFYRRFLHPNCQVTVSDTWLHKIYYVKKEHYDVQRITS